MQEIVGTPSRITLQQLTTNYNRLYTSLPLCTVVKSDAVEDKEAPAKTYTASIRSSSGSIYPVIVKLEPDRRGAYSLDSFCKVDCTCKTYVFRNNAQLRAVGGALYARYTLQPTKTGKKANPDNVVTCCKHIYSYISFLLKHGSRL